MKKTTLRRIVIILAALLIVLGAALGGAALMQRAKAGNDWPADVTMVQLLATPERYHGQTVRVIGVGNLEFEGNGLYLHKEDLTYRTGNCLWVELTAEAGTWEQVSSCNGQYVIVEGVFDMNDHGHMGLFAGAITGITRWDPWEQWMKEINEITPE